MLPTRGWELLFGALLGFNINKLSISKDKKKKEILAIFGFLVLLFSFAFFDTTNSHPTYLTLIPVIATYLIIQDTNKENFINKLLSFKILIFIGLISYSFYLWHHPIFSFAKILGVGQESLLIKFLFITLSIVLGFLTYRFIEKPFRNEGEQILRIGKVKILGAISILIIIILHLFAGSQKAQYPSIAQNLYVKTWFTTKTYFKPCFQRKTFFCSFNEKKDNPTVFLVGDSIMASIQEELKDQLIKRNINFIPMTNAGCDFLEINMGSVWSELGTVNNQKANCNQKIYDNRIKKINSKKEATIILHLNYIADKNEKILKNFSKRILNYLNENYKIILIYPIPQMSQNVSNEIEKDIQNNKFPVNLVNIDISKYLDASKKINKFFDSIDHKNLYKIYPHKKFCNTYLKNKCVGNTDEYILFTDTAHLSKKGSELINMDLAKIIDKIY